MPAPPVMQIHTDVDAHLAASLIARAFHDLAVAHWIATDPAARAHVLYANFRMWIDHAVRVGEVWVTGNRASAAVWFPYETPLPPIHDYQIRLRQACGRAANRLLLLDDIFAEHQPEQPHWDLMFLATTEPARGRGHGSQLLTHVHGRLDEKNLPATLVAACTRSRQLYLRHGYHDTAAPVHLPDGPPMYPMTRDPNPTGGGK